MATIRLAIAQTRAKTIATIGPAVSSLFFFEKLILLYVLSEASKLIVVLLLLSKLISITSSLAKNKAFSKSYSYSFFPLQLNL